MKSQSGFTLIELMVVVVIIGLLAAVAVPSYQAFIESGRRAECKAFALDIASRQERHWTENQTYGVLNAGTDELNMPNGNQSENNSCSAIVTGGGTFNISVTMTPADTECGVLTLNNVGVRGSSIGSAAECWK